MNFNCYDHWVTKENIIDLIKNGLECIRENTVDLISMDLDGNDYYFIKEILEIQPQSCVHIETDGEDGTILVGEGFIACR